MITPTMLGNRRAQVGSELHSVIYSSEKDDEILIVPQLRMHSGLYVEQSPSAQLAFQSPCSEIGQEAKKSLLHFDRSDGEAQSREWPKKTDWQAFKCSKAKSVKTFEERYLRIAIQTVNANLRLEGPEISRGEVYVGGWRAWGVTDEELGRLILNIHAATRHLRENNWA